ncbi:DnaD domain-containing protein [Lentibacillus jeotgali]|uniref:DnaD domain-containing protein n=1 Tax=Lentibacillus jeotgali TaxID=558169 RepID=UPI000262703F|nr:DnaD domain protein [Lentibacillus jeotgali]
MNYIKEMNAFYDQLIFNPLSSSAISVWHTLMHYNNKSGWQRTFTVPAGFIELTSGVKGTTFKRARTELQEKGYIAVTSGSGNQAATYRMISQIKTYEQHDSPTHHTAKPQPVAAIHHASYEPIHQPSEKQLPTTAIGQISKEPNERIQTNTMDLTANHQMDQKANVTTDRTPAHKPSDNTVQTLVHNPDCSMDHSADHTPAPLFKQYINKTNTKHKPITTTTAAIQFYQQNFNVPGSYVLHDISQWITDMGDALVLDAMKRAVEQNKPTWHYVKGILKSWKAKGITTVEQVAIDDKRFRNQYAQKPTSRTSDKDEVVPEWFKERKKQQTIERERQQRKIAKIGSACTESEREECERLLAKYSKKKRARSG